MPFLPKKNQKTGEKFKKALLKIDIEGYEPYAFQNASLLFDTIDIQTIFMEWAYMSSRAPMLGEPYVSKIIFLIDFLFRHRFRPYPDYNNKQELSKDNWRNWPFDIVWNKI